MGPSRQHVRRMLSLGALGYIGGLLGLLAGQSVWPQRDGWLAFSQVVAPYLALTLVGPGLAVGFWGTWRLRVLLGLGGLIILKGCAPGPEGVALPAAPGALVLPVVQWNVRDGGQYTTLRPVLLAQPAAVVALEEINPWWLEHDVIITRRYPYRWRGAAAPDGLGNVLLSAYPIRAGGQIGPAAQPILWTQVDLGAGRRLTVLVAHLPRPETCPNAWGGPGCYEPARRDAALRQLIAFVATTQERGESVLVLGDLNLTEREPAYTDLGALLQDAGQRSGRGNTWRPARFMNNPWALLRIDYLFNSTAIASLRTTVDCTPRGSDHCILRGWFAIP